MNNLEQDRLKIQFKRIKQMIYTFFTVQSHLLQWGKTQI